MLLASDTFYMEPVRQEDLDAVLAVYQSNKAFLMHHMGREFVTRAWLESELAAMAAAGFYSCKIAEHGALDITGIADFKIAEETYLSLLMLHGDRQGLGLGKQIYQAIEDYAKQHRSTSIRIDVVTGYEKDVFRFWRSRGFSDVQEVTLNWAGKSLRAMAMKKAL